jgi:hypothetical protein
MAKDSYPQWKNGEELFVFGPRGVVVATATDQLIEVSVCKGIRSVEHVLCASGEILIGDKGLIVGNVASENSIPGIGDSGHYAVLIYTNGISDSVTKVNFFVEHM